jgi:CRISPR-associated exonuclease Cas4
VRAKKCDTCSLFQLCLPEVTQTARSAARFVGRQFAAHLRDGLPTTDSFDLGQALA